MWPGLPFFFGKRYTKGEAMKRNGLLDWLGAFLCGVLVALLAGPALADDTYWILPPPDEGDWFEPTNWDNGVPTSAVDAYIDNGGTVQVTTGYASAEDLNIGYVSSGAVRQTGGTLEAETTIRLGDTYISGSQGSYNLDNGSMRSRILAVQSGTFVQNGGNVVLPKGATNNRLSIEKDGVYELKGGLLDTYRETIDGRFVHSAGTNDTEYQIRLGWHYGDSGTYELSGTGDLRTERFNVGYQGEGFYRQSGGTATFYYFRVGDWYGSGSDPDGIGSVELSAGTLTTSSSVISEAGTGTFRQTGGTHQCLERLYLSKAYYSTGVPRGTYDLVDGILQTREVYIGRGDQAIFTQTGGTHTTTFLRIHPKGHYIYSGGSLTVNGGLQVEGGFTFDDQPLVLDARHAIINLSAGDLQGGSLATLQADTNSLVIFRTGFDKASLGNYQNAGLEAWSGSPVDIPASRTIYGWAEIQDPVQCAGSLIATTGGEICLLRGVYVSGTGNVDLGDGDLSVHNLVSGMSGGQLTTQETFVGGGRHDVGYDPGRFAQSGGIHSTSELWLGESRSEEGTYEMSGGQLSADQQIIGHWGIGRFIQTGGINTVTDEDYGLVLAWGADGQGSYELGGSGLLSASRIIVGYQGDGVGTFVQTGGENQISNSLTIGSIHRQATGAYTLTGGTLSADVAHVGLYGQGSFTQTGGSVVITNDTNLGSQSGSVGIYTISGGSLTTDNLVVGRSAKGTLSITNPAAQLTVQNSLQFGSGGALNAVPGAAIHMTGAAFENESTDEAALAGLGNLNLVFEGGASDTDPVEVGGEDKGPVWDGFVQNFTFGGLSLGGADVGQVQLVDDFDNGNRGGPAGAAEAQYVKRLKVGSGSTLDLNGLNLYYLKGSFDPSTTVETGGGSLTKVPAIEAVSGTALSTAFTAGIGTFGLGELAVADAADIVVETDDGAQTTYAGGQFTLLSSLASDSSSDGVALGLFEGGTVDLEDDLGADLLTGDLLELVLEEIQGENLLAGSGRFELTGGSLEGGFAWPIGEVFQIAFAIQPEDLSDFSGSFTSVSNVTLTPEPATLGLLTAGVVGLVLRRRRAPQN